MPAFTDILYDKHHRVRGAAWLTINRPDARNALNMEVRRLIAQHLFVVSVTRPNWRSVKPWKWPLKTACRL